MSQDQEYIIRQLAYELWEQDGKPPGRHVDYWLLAEKKLSGDPRGASLTDPAKSTEGQPS